MASKNLYKNGSIKSEVQWLVILCTGVFAFLFLARVSSPYFRIMPTYLDIPELGTIEGTLYPSARVFQGIPFGTAERFQPPVLAAAWKPETLVARQFRPACMHPSGYRKEGVSEDCLYLNVYTPTWGVGDKPNPVLVWFHGGGYTLGAGSDTAPDDAAELVWNHKVVVVSTNYRLGVFGFSGSDSFRARDNSTGNFGIQDQRLALDWVQKHIRAFGGDPARVTVMGWSAGAASISVHLVAPKSRGHFSKAILMSGGFTDWAALPMSAAEAAFDAVCTCVGCAKTDRECLLARSAEELVRCGNGQWYGPVVDGVEMTVSPYDAIKTRSKAVDWSVPIIIGNTLGDKLVDLGPHADADKLRRYLETQMAPAAAKKAMELYPLSIFRDYALRIFPHEWSSAYWAARVMGADKDFTCVMRRVVQQYYKNGGIAFWYNWLQPQVFDKKQMAALRKASLSMDAKPVGGSCYPCPGAGHGSDLAFLFENPTKIDVDGKVVQGAKLTDRLQGAYTNFIWYEGNATENIADANEVHEDSRLTVPLPDWYPYHPKRGNAMRFAAGVSQEAQIHPASANISVKRNRYSHVKQTLAVEKEILDMQTHEQLQSLFFKWADGVMADSIGMGLAKHSLALQLKASLDDARRSEARLAQYAHEASAPKATREPHQSHVRLSKPLDGLAQLVEGRSDFFAELAQCVGYEVQRLLRYTLLSCAKPMTADVEAKAQRQVSDGLRTVLGHLSTYVDEVVTASQSSKIMTVLDSGSAQALQHQLDAVVAQDQELQEQLASDDRKIRKTTQLLNHLRSMYYQDLEALRARLRSLLSRYLDHFTPEDLEMAQDMLNVRFFNPDSALDEDTEDAVKRKAESMQQSFNVEKEAMLQQLAALSREDAAIRQKLAQEQRKVRLLQSRLTGSQGFEEDDDAVAETEVPIVQDVDSDRSHMAFIKISAVEDALQKLVEWLENRPDLWQQLR
ncbi:D2, partial [Symbiodinium pilosum]